MIRPASTNAQADAPKHDDHACAHCGLPVPAAMRDPKADTQFCCHGCKSVYRMLHQTGFGDYYRLKQQWGAGDAPQAEAFNPASAQRYAAFDDPAFLDAHVRRSGDGVCQVDLLVRNAHCAACLWLLERLPRLAPGVLEARLSLHRKVVRVVWQPQQTKLSEIAGALHRMGYPPRPTTEASETAAHAHRVEDRKQLIALALAGACAGNAMLLALAVYSAERGEGAMDASVAALLRWLSAAVGLIALAGPGRVFFRGAWNALRARAGSLDMPIALALGVGGLAGLVNAVAGHGDLYFDSLCVLTFLLLVGRFVQRRQQRRADEAVDLARALTPVTCRVVDEQGRARQAPIEALQAGMTAEVWAGEVFPADGQVTQGASEADHAVLTGETRPEAIAPGDDVFAGARNLSSTVRITVTAVAEASRVGGLMRRVAEGLEQRPPIVLLTDRIARGFLVAVSLAAGATLASWWAASGDLDAGVRHAVALLILACPCALALATPLTLAAASAVAARRGVFVKRAAAFQTLASAKHRGARLWFDKTGTLTEGQPKLLRWHGPDALRTLAAALEGESPHPIGKAIVEACAGDPCDTVALQNRREQGSGVSATWDDRGDSHQVALGSPRFVAEHGATLSAQAQSQVEQAHQSGHTVVVLAIDNIVEAFIELGDSVRQDAHAAVTACASAGWSPGLLTGDAQGPALAVAARVGISPDNVIAAADPEQKQAIVATREQDVVVLVGDGVNDAAAMSSSDVGIAVQGGAEAALAAADVYLGRGVADLPSLLAISKRTMRIVRVNLGLSLAYNATAIGLAAAGLVTPLLAAVLMPISSGLSLVVAVSGMSRVARGRRHTPSAESHASVEPAPPPLPPVSTAPRPTAPPRETPACLSSSS